MVKTLLKRDCISCKYLTSYYEEYDFDEFEPRWCGRCSKDEEDKYAGEGHSCKLWKEKKKLSVV